MRLALVLLLSATAYADDALDVREANFCHTEFQAKGRAEQYCRDFPLDCERYKETADKNISDCRARWAAKITPIAAPTEPSQSDLSAIYTAAYCKYMGRRKYARAGTVTTRMAGVYVTHNYSQAEMAQGAVSLANKVRKLAKQNHVIMLTCSNKEVKKADPDEVDNVMNDAATSDFDD